MVHSDSFLAFSKEDVRVDDVCTFYVEFMWQLIGGYEVTSESSILTGSDFMYIKTGAFELAEEQQTCFFFYWFGVQFPLCHFLILNREDNRKRSLKII